MKTLTEFFGPTLRKAQEEVEKITGGSKPQKAPKKGKKTESQDPNAAGVTNEALASGGDETQAAAAPLTGDAAQGETPAAEGETTAGTPAEAAAAAASGGEAPAADAAATDAPAEESADAKVSAKLAEISKYEGDKLAWFQKAVELVRAKKGNLKRVIVGQLNEGEKAPAGFTEIDGKVYGIEFFPEAGRPAARSDDRDERGGRGGRGGKGGRGKGRGKGDRGGRGGERGERGFGGPRGEGGGGGDRPRGPRAPRQAPEPYTGPNRIIPKGKTAATGATTSGAPVSNDAVKDPAQDSGSTS